jgi:hypothetical protein
MKSDFSISLIETAKAESSLETALFTFRTIAEVVKYAGPWKPCSSQRRFAIP